MSGIVIQSPGVCTDRSLPMRNPLWSPAMLAGRAFDLDADTGCATDGGGRVTSWTDQAQAIAMTPSGGDGAVKNHAIGPHIAPLFTLDGLSGSAPISTAAAHWTMWAVIDALDVSAPPIQMLLFAGPLEILLAGGGGQFLVVGPNANAFAPTTLTPGQHIIVLSQQVAGTQVLRVDGAAVGLPQAGCAPIALGVPQLASYDPGLKNTAIGALGLAAGVRPVAEVTKLEGFLAARFGLQSLLPADHPYKAALPRRLS